MDIKKMERAVEIAFGALLVLFLISVIFPKERKFRQKSFQTAFFGAKAGIKSITLGKNSAEMALEKRGSGWIAEFSDGKKYQADKNTVDSFLAVLGELRSASVVAKKEKNWSSLGVDSGNALAVSVLYDDDRSSTVFFGAQGTGSAEISFRAQSGESVFQTKNDVSLYLRADPSFWADPYLLASSGESAENLQLLTFSDKNGDKFFSGAALSEKASDVLSLRRGLICAAREGSSEADAHLRAVFLSGREISLSFFSSDELYFVRSEIVEQNEKIEYWFEISSWTFQNITALLYQGS